MVLEDFVFHRFVLPKGALLVFFFRKIGLEFHAVGGLHHLSPM